MREQLPGSAAQVSYKHVAIDFGVLVVLIGLGFGTFLVFNKMGLVGSVREVPASGKTDAQEKQASRYGNFQDDDEEALASQIIEFDRPQAKSGAVESLGPRAVRPRGSQAPSRSPGTLARVRLLNQIETHGSVPAFVQVMDYALGQTRYGNTLVGEASGRADSGRVELNFTLIRDPRRPAAADRLTAIALSMDGTLGVAGHPKEGLAERAFLGGAESGTRAVPGALTDSNDKQLSSILLKALMSGLSDELGGDIAKSKARASVLVLDPGTEFLIQLTDFYPQQNGGEQ